MIAVSDAFKTAMKQPIKELDAYIQLDENNKLTSADDLISFKISCDTSLCKTAMRKLEAKYLGEHNLIGKWVHVGFGVKLSNGTFEYLDYGSFLITEMTTSKDTDTTQIIGYDKMISAMTPYEKLEIEYPMDLYTYTQKICEACGLILGNNKYSTQGSIVSVNICPQNITDWEAGHYATNGKKAERDGRIRLKNLLPVDNSLSYTFTTDINNVKFGIREMDENGNMIKDDGTVYNGNTLTLEPNTKSLAVFLWGATSLNFEAYSNMFADGTLAPKILYETTAEGTLSNEMFDWQITGELWENINGITYRDILVQIAQTTGTTCIIGNDNKVYLKSLTNTNEELTYNNMIKLKLEPIYGEINSVILGRDPVVGEDVFLKDETSINTNGLTEFRIDNNEIVDKNREEAIEPIYDLLHGIKYYPFETTTEGLGWYEIADSFNIKNDTGDVFNTSLFNFSITIDGAIKEILKSVANTKTQSQYQYASPINKRIKNTEIIVNKQEEYIESLVTDMYEENGVVNTKFTNVYQDINNIVNSVQNSGGNNLIKNSVLFAMTDGVPNEWTTEGDGTLSTKSDTEALIKGGISGHSFVLCNKKIRQRITVKADSDDIPAEQKTYYSFSTKIKKSGVGTCYVKIYNPLEEHIIELDMADSSDYKTYEIKALLPKSNYYDIEFYGSADSNATFTDCMFSQGEYKTQWTQANGEIMNTQVNINLDGVLVKSSVYLGDYTVMSPLEFAGYSNIAGTLTKVFSLNKDTTIVKKLKAEDEIKMIPIKIVPVTSGDLQGWAFVKSEEV